MSFKKDLEEHFKQFDASPILFVGSGVSKRYLNLFCWEDLLRFFSEKIGENHVQLRAKSNKDWTVYAQLLAKTYSNEWWNTEEGKRLVDENEDLFTDEQSALKVSISSFISKAHLNITDDIALQEEISLLSKANIDGIITTNWDLFLEDRFPKFTTFIGQEALLNKSNF